MNLPSLAKRRGVLPIAAPIALVAVCALPLLLAAPASAHHLMDLTGMKPGVVSGLLSGLAHPILGPDHLLFLLAIGLVGIVQPFRWVLALLGCGLVGNALGLALPGFPWIEPLVALSVALTGLVLARRLPPAVLVPAFLLHGYALSGAVLGWEPTPIGFYLVGLLVSQSLLLLVALTAVRRWRRTASSGAVNITAGLLMGIGLAFTWSALVA
ncbi:hydrogenase/urease accessory protein [Cyanobium sp. Copco_Reservoir_LC18]|jgi:urease accessory protein|uniref:HupE/UreJ family protein n=1 Tax=Cyanobium sp. Copco_Reservoir_LC18 TaxID=1328305 RepID=UPI0013584151|nr:HupE/UreJ family protein [Cyanobium sp. Copco_Reservoir_LC18]KAF0654194.1 hydrogenase/urease accessory protein [Cyanobium sp. Copco_Reservoir_LC18]